MDAGKKVFDGKIKFFGRQKKFFEGLRRVSSGKIKLFYHKIIFFDGKIKFFCPKIKFFEGLRRVSSAKIKLFRLQKKLFRRKKTTKNT